MKNSTFGFGFWFEGSERDISERQLNRVCGGGKCLIDGKIANCSENSKTDALANAAIMAGLNFFTTLTAIASQSAGAVTTSTLVAAGIAAGLAFFTSLAIQRGLKKGEAE